MGGGGASGLLIDACHQFQRACRIFQPVREIGHARYRIDQQCRADIGITFRHAMPQRRDLISDSGAAATLTLDEISLHQLAQAVLDVGDVIAIGHLRQIADAFRPVVHADDMQQRVLRTAGRKFDHRLKTFRLPAPESLVGAHQCVFDFGDVDLERRARQVPAAIEKIPLVQCLLGFHPRLLRHATMHQRTGLRP